MSEVAAVIKQIEARFQEKSDQSGALDGKRVEFQLTGDGGGTYLFAVDAGQLTVTPGGAVSPDLTVTVSGADFVAISSGRLGAMQAFMSGKLKIKGDMGLAMRLQSLFA